MNKQTGTPIHDCSGDIVSLQGLELKVAHLHDNNGELPDYWQAWVNGTQDDGLSRNEAINNALARHCSLNIESS